MKKRRNLLVFLALLAIGALFAAQQTNALESTQYTWQSGRVPQSFDGYRIVQISDLHGKRFGGGQKRLLQMIRDFDPDMIALTGDILDRRTRGLDAARELLAGTAGLAPIYYVDGNHDPRSPVYREFRSLLDEFNVTVLEGTDAFILERGGGAMTVAGCGYWDYDGLGRPVDLLLYHSPSVFEQLDGDSCGLVLAGHMHGGQVALPGGRAIVSPAGKLFPEYAGGFYELNGCAMAVSKGLGTTGVPFRLFARPEVVCVVMEML